MPADILGSEVLEESDTGRRSFRFIAGPVFCQLLMADEINRASPGTKLADEIEALGQRLHAVRESIGRVIFGQQRVVDQTLITLLAGGHALVIGVPGLAKTLLVETLGIVFGLEDKRVQCTPDLMPADILGSEVLEESPKASAGSFSANSRWSIKPLSRCSRAGMP